MWKLSRKGKERRSPPEPCFTLYPAHLGGVHAKGISPARRTGRFAPYHPAPEGVGSRKTQTLRGAGTGTVPVGRTRLLRKLPLLPGSLGALACGLGACRAFRSSAPVQAPAAAAGIPPLRPVVRLCSRLRLSARATQAASPPLPIAPALPCSLPSASAVPGHRLPSAPFQGASVCAALHWFGLAPRGPPLPACALRSALGRPAAIVAARGLTAFGAFRAPAGRLGARKRPGLCAGCLPACTGGKQGKQQPKTACRWPFLAPSRPPPGEARLQGIEQGRHQPARRKRKIPS